MSDWLELELAHHLGPADAPPELWRRLTTPRPGPRSFFPRWMPLAAPAALALVATVSTFWLAAPRLDLRQLAAEELGDSRRLEFSSADPARINRWLRDETGLDPALPATAVKLEGARVIHRHGVPMGVVAFHAGSQDAVLLVAGAGCARAGTDHGQLIWKSRGLVFALACSDPSEPKAACLLCHASM